MIKFCNDIDIAKYEPVLFGELHLPWQVQACGDNGEISGMNFSASGADFVSANVEAGDVIYLRSSDGAIDGVYEIVSVDSATELTVSVIRSEDDADAIGPPAGTGVYYRVSTFEPQIVEAGLRLTEYFGIGPGRAGTEIEAEDIIDAEVLKPAAVFCVLSSVYAMLASNATDENFWAKSLHYKKLFEKARERCQVCIDTDGDGVADLTLDGSSIRMSRD
jgi:hypothetical protein